MIRVRVGDFRIGKEERKAINDVLDSGRITEGEKVREFEREWAEFIGTKYAITVSSGSSALIAGLTALKHYNIKQGTKIITSPITYIATTNAIVLSGFEPVFVDIDRETFGITPENIRAYLEQVKDINEYSLILPVHLMGYPCDMDEINKIASDYNLQTFEDSAQAHGTIYKGKKTGSLSLLSIFSFYVAHNIQAGEMGAIATDNREIARLIKKIKANGRVCDCPVCRRSEGKCPRLTSYKGEDDFDPRFTHDFIGYNFKVMEFQAVLGIVQLKKVDWITKKRNENVKYLNEELEGFSDVIQLPKYSKDISYLAYPITILRPEVISRKKLRYELEKKGVETRPLFGCIPTQQPAYSYLKKQYEGKLSNAEYIGKNSFYIGCHQYLEQEDLDFEVEQIKNVINEGSK
jgi:dTDP-4-amino-4,6-dideoxygalactose transaminase